MAVLRDGNGEAKSARAGRKGRSNGSQGMRPDSIDEHSLVDRASLAIRNQVLLASTEVVSDVPHEQPRRADQLLFWHTMSQLAPLRNPSQHSDDLHRAFVTSYWSNAATRPLSQYINIYHWSAPRSPALSKSRDALCLLHLGTRYGDKRLLFEGRVQHCEALRRLRLEIQRPGAVKDDSVLGACYTLAQCEVYRVISRDSGGWQMHIPGILAVIKQRGANTIRSPFARATLHNVKQVVAMHGLLMRKRVLFGTPGWAGPASRASKPALVLTDIFFQIGALLETTDRLQASRNREHDEHELVATLTAMIDIERQLQQWLLKMYESSGDEGMPYKEINLSRFPSFTRLCGWSNTFSKVFDFPCFLSATAHVYVWVGLLEIRKAIADVARLHPYPLVRPVNQDAMLVAAAEEAASNLCKSVPFMAQQEHSFAGILACGTSLHFAGAWYRERQDRERTAWCDTVREALQRNTLTGHAYDSVDLSHPLLTWWMLPDIFE